MERYITEALPLGKQAVAGALDSAGLAPGDVGLFAVATCTGYATPGLDIRLASDLGMPLGLQRLLIGHMGCYAALPGIAAVSDFVTARSRPAVLLCLELTSLHVQPAVAELEQVVTHALFSDAAAAVVLEPAARRGRRVAGMVARTDHSTADHMTWDVTDLGFRMGLSPRVPDVLGRHVGGVVEELLGEAGLRVEDVAGWAVHPGGPRILDVVRDELGLSRGADGRLPAGARRARQLLLGHRAAGARGARRRRRAGGRDGLRPRPDPLRDAAAAGLAPPPSQLAAGPCRRAELLTEVGLFRGQAEERLGGHAVTVRTAGRHHDRADEPLDQRRRAQQHPVPDLVVQQLQGGLGRQDRAARGPSAPRRRLPSRPP